MSLTTLTFNSSTGTQNSAIRGKIMVLKTDQFFGTEEVCVIGKLVDGAITREMIVCGTDKKIVSVESNYGEGFCCHKGAQVVLMIANSNKEEYNSGEEIHFERVALEEVSARPKGRLIIA
ncbi:MAG: hypothetical protein PHX27_01165 [Candidatus ainarchaeum sp.]|nr:hypothetical protein [Candidatus ainarchaeum sp.]